MATGGPLSVGPVWPGPVWPGPVWPGVRLLPLTATHE